MAYGSAPKHQPCMCFEFEGLLEGRFHMGSSKLGFPLSLSNYYVIQRLTKTDWFCCFSVGKRLLRAILLVAEASTVAGVAGLVSYERLLSNKASKGTMLVLVTNKLAQLLLKTPSPLCPPTKQAARLPPKIKPPLDDPLVLLSTLICGVALPYDDWGWSAGHATAKRLQRKTRWSQKLGLRG